jgi:hypothetical protein
MRMIAVTAVTLALAAGAAPGASVTKPHLVVSDSAPLTVHGSNFKPHERVRVVYQADSTTSVVRTMAANAGTFTARFAGVRLDVCAVKQLVAIGSLGSRAFVKFMPAACPPPAAVP